MILTRLQGKTINIIKFWRVLKEQQQKNSINTWSFLTRNFHEYFWRVESHFPNSFKHWQENYEGCRKISVICSCVLLYSSSNFGKKTHSKDSSGKLFTNSPAKKEVHSFFLPYQNKMKPKSVSVEPQPSCSKDYVPKPQSLNSRKDKTEILEKEYPYKE